MLPYYPGYHPPDSPEEKAWVEITGKSSAQCQAESDLAQRREYMPKVWALFAAGWTLEWPEYDSTQLYGFKWRRPPKRPGRPGRLYGSTDQAYRHMFAEKAGEAV